MPLAVYLKSCGYAVSGSDRSYDQGKSPEKFNKLKACGIALYPQDGSGVSEADILVVSTAIEDTIPDVKAAKDRNIPIIKRGKLLAEFFNGAKTSIGIAGTSGKSTVTGMIGTIFEVAGKNPTVLNGGKIKNFSGEFPDIRLGDQDLFIAELDESDGSIEHYAPSIAVINNIALDHKSIEEIEGFFKRFAESAKKALIINCDDIRLKNTAHNHEGQVITYSLEDKSTDLYAKNIIHKTHGIDFTLHYKGQDYAISLKVPGQHNIMNALAAIGAALAGGLEINAIISGLLGFEGIKRRLEYVGEKGGITVIDDFAHNPDKISASLQTLKAFEGRLIIMFQPHGFGPLRLMGQEIIDSYARYLSDEDLILMPEVYYAGGTVDRSVTSAHIIDGLIARNKKAMWFESRDKILPFLEKEAKSGDRLVIMGARDDTLSDFANKILKTK